MNERRKIAIFTDAHGLLEPVEAVLKDVEKRGITEIYSLGDNIGVGPNPKEVINLLEEYHVKSIAGNAEDYVTLGTEPFQIYFSKLKMQSQLWTLSKLGEKEKGIISLYPHSIELMLGGKKIALCHFANDVRIDYQANNCHVYKNKVKNFLVGYKQFLNTNSVEQLRLIKKYAESGADDDTLRGYVSAYYDPLFMKKQVDYFDALIQGHVHWKLYEKSASTEFFTIRAVGIAYDKDPVDTASYVILTEQEEGFKFEEVLVRYDREKMLTSIINCDNPDKKIMKFVEFPKR